MSQWGLEQFGAYQKARDLFDLFVSDLNESKGDPPCVRLIAQQAGSAASICANIEEGYGRLSRAEYVRFLDISRGATRENRGPYERLKHRLTGDVIKQCIELLIEIIGIRTASIVRMRKDRSK